MKYLLLFLLAVFLEVAVLQALFKPGFIAPDLVLILLLSRAYLLGRSTILWAVFGGVLLDIMTDTIGLNLALETLSVYIFMLIEEKILFRTVVAFLISAGVTLLVKKSLSLLMMKIKFSFDVSVSIFLGSWLLEMVALLAIYLLYIRRKE